jgi:putative salt-induced outer membrane protein
MTTVRTSALAAFAALTIAAAPIAAQEPAGAAQEPLCPCPPPAPPPPLWTGSLGLSYLATTGNSETETLGLSTAWDRRSTPWGIELRALAHRAETERETTAERYLASVRGKRALSDRHELFAGLVHERDEFAGFDQRSIVEGGALWRALVGPVHELAFDAGLTWTSEDRLDGTDDEWTGAVAGVAWAWKITPAAALRERLLFYPNFDDSDDWRLTSETALDAALADSWALRVSYLVQRDNRPPAGFEETDTSTAVSLVWKR